ncbi:hypothetical protein [Neptunitalea lumnitzerae]|uniref:Outer membrane protein beta-barrel domain-containing protein n=1 Tax=Neptunitalea lumnitzerae TaxID=2965509 RepID=A0ABQ5MJG8_9FLAO|nr:hypothetical protein [Neptunitalea sp. Y10]GLB49077.1 hypothetical protein Y10_14450 [Neptunitalea sp. Y10]
MIRVITFMTMLVLMFSTYVLSAQVEQDTLKLEVDKKKAGLSDDKQELIKSLKLEKEAIVDIEKNKLKEAVRLISEKQAKGEITEEEAKKQKEAAAKLAAQNIENKTAIVDNKIALAERGEDVENGEAIQSTLIFDKDGLRIENRKVYGDTLNRRHYKYDKRTTGSLVVALGLNNSIIDGEGIDGSPYEIGGSRFFEIGYMWNTRLFLNSNAVRFRYGITFQNNGLKPTDNMYFVENGDQTLLQEHPNSLKKVKLRMDNIVVPVFFEFGPSKKIDRGDYFRYSNDEMFKFGIGAYAGLNYSTRQKLKYKNDGDRVKEKIKSDFNTNNFIYGVAAYIGIGDTSLYAKYDLNPIFHDAVKEQNNVSLGIRFDLD